MKRKTETDKPVGRMIRVKDFLPSPEELVVPEKRVKVTVLWNRLRQAAERSGYTAKDVQRLIKEIRKK